MEVIASTIVRSIFDFCLPRECPACRAGYESDTPFCPDCEEELDRLDTAARCERCSMPVTLPGAPCAQCLEKGLSQIKQIVSIGVFKGPLKPAIHRMKYERRWALAERLADRVFARQDVQAVLDQAEVIVPVPLHRQRQRSRGYNQADVIAQRIAFLNSPGRKAGDRSANGATSPIDPRPSGLGYQRLFHWARTPHMLVAYPAERLKPTDTQTHLHSRAQRIENLRHAFALIDPAAIASKHIVIVDDVLTTGATLVSLAQTLKRAKPASISALVLAVADPKGRAFEVI